MMVLPHAAAEVPPKTAGWLAAAKSNTNIYALEDSPNASQFPFDLCSAGVGRGEEIPDALVQR